MVLADLRAMRWTALAAIALIGLAVAIGIVVAAQERALRSASARAADDFDLLIGPPGSQTQLMLTTVFLQPEALPLLRGSTLASLQSDPRVLAVAPLAFGDQTDGLPIVGTTAAFATRWGRLRPSQGRMFEREDEVVIGASVPLRLGDQITPSHAPLGHGASSHPHENTHYTIVGRMPPLGSPWDRAIVAPIESVWETHGLGNGHASDDGAIGPPFDADPPPAVPAIVVKPRSVADAYALRAQFRTGETMAFFPAEVLVSAYRALGDARDVMVVVAALNNLLVFVAIVLLLVTLTGLRRRRHALLRALGASRAYILLVAWCGGAILMAVGCLSGLLLGWIGAGIVGTIVEAHIGLVLTTGVDADDCVLVAAMALIGSVLAIAPALLAWRASPSAGLRGSA